MFLNDDKLFKKGTREIETDMNRGPYELKTSRSYPRQDAWIGHFHYNKSILDAINLVYDSKKKNYVQSNSSLKLPSPVYSQLINSKKILFNSSDVSGPGSQAQQENYLASLAILYFAAHSLI